MKPKSQDLLEELEHFSELFDAFTSTVMYFIYYKTKGNLNSFTKKGNSWVYNPNFVTFDLHYKQAEKSGDESMKNITVCLRGNIEEFASEYFPHLRLTPAQNGYCRCKVKDMSQMDGLLFYIGRAYELYNRGRTRDKLRQKVTEY